MKKNSRMFIFSACFSMLFLLFINGCYSFFSIPADAETVTYRGPLTVALQENLYSQSLEKDLMQQFAKAYSLQINFVPFKTLNQAEALLSLEKADMVFTRVPTSNTNFTDTYSLVYDDMKLSTVCSGPLKDATDIYVPAQYFEITESPDFAQTFHDLELNKSTSTSLQLKKQALKQPGFCYVTDARLARRSSLIFSDLKVVWTAKKSEPVAWVTRKDLKELNRLTQVWFQSQVRQNQIRKYWDRYEASTVNLSSSTNKRLEKDIQNTLPQWRDLFEKYAKKNQIPWTLLAAVAYQESKWDNEARSYTGVRGIMQITTSTAEHLGIEDRSDPEQSIEGGAFYLKYLYKKTPKQLPAYERWAQALAAYNMGWAHIRDARILAKKLNLDSNRWLKFKKVLPLLAKEEFHRDLTFGAARGDETVDFVDQVFAYTEYLNATFTRPSQTSQDF